MLLEQRESENNDTEGTVNGIMITMTTTTTTTTTMLYFVHDGSTLRDRSDQVRYEQRPWNL